MRFPLKMILLATTLVGATSALGACTDGYDSGVGVGYDAASSPGVRSRRHSSRFVRDAVES